MQELNNAWRNVSTPQLQWSMIDWFTVLIRFILNLSCSYTAPEFSNSSVGPATNWEESLNTGELFSFDISAHCQSLSVLNKFLILATQFHINDMIFQTQDDIYPLFAAMATSQHCIIDRNRTIAALVDNTSTSTWRVQVVSLWRRLHWQTRIRRPRQHWHQDSWAAGRHNSRWFCCRWWGDIWCWRWRWRWRRALLCRCCGQASSPGPRNQLKTC